MKHSRISITNSKGIALNATLDLPANQKPNYFAIFAHCFTCNSNLNAVRHISKSLTNHGFGVVRFDFTGLGLSKGDFAESHFSGNVQDLMDVNDFITQNYQAPCLLIGHSLGGAAVLVAGAKLDNIKAITTIGAPSHIDHVRQHFSEALPDNNNQNFEVNIGGRPFTINNDFLADFDKLNLLETVENIKKPLLILHSPTDTIVGIQNAQELYLAAKHPKSYISLDQADHLLTVPADALYVGDMIGGWVKRYFPTTENQMLEPNGEQLIASLNLKEDQFTTYIQTKRHNFVSDEPESFGGNDFGPSPYDYLSASLAACTTMTLQLYANRKKWELDEVFVYVTYSRKHFEDMDTEAGQSKAIDYMLKKLKLVGNLTAEQKERLREIAGKCPVHRTLNGSVKIETVLLDE